MNEQQLALARVFPTPVGMNRESAGAEPVLICIPHARGDEPSLARRLAFRLMYSPRPWG